VKTAVFGKQQPIINSTGEPGSTLPSTKVMVTTPILNVGFWLRADIRCAAPQRLLSARKRTSAARKSQWQPLMSAYRS